MTSLFSSLVATIKQLPRIYLIGGGVALVAVGLIVANVMTRASVPNAAVVNTTSHVQVATVGELSTDSGPLPVTGKVTSVSEATILAQTSGEISHLLRSLGDYVSAGTIIARFEDSSQQAALLQAQGAYDAVYAAAVKAAGSTAQNYQSGAITAVQSAYAALDDAVHTRADQLFSNPKSPSPEIVIQVPDSALVILLKEERVNIEATLAEVHSLSQNVTSTTVEEGSALILRNAQKVITFLDHLIQAVNETPSSLTTSPTTLAAYQSSLATARTEVVAAMSSITSAKVTYDSNDAATTEAGLKQALGALNAAKANVEKAIVRSPISGTIVSLPVTEGDFVSSFSQVAVVSNPGALYIDVQVTSSDAETLSVGNKATVDGAYPGIITFIAPALDPSTGKIQVKVGFTGSVGRALSAGEITTVTLNRSQTKSTTSADIVIPIIAAKISPTGPIVFTVNGSGTLEAHPIKLGAILGDRIVVSTGLTRDMKIVTDARGLSEGEAVLVNQ